MSFAAHLQVVDVVLGLAVARQHALDGEFGVPDHWPAARPSELSKTSSTAARATGLRWPEPLKITSCIDSPRSSGGFRFAEHQHSIHHVGFAAAVGADDTDQLPRQGAMVVGSTKDLKPASLSLVRAHVGKSWLFFWVRRPERGAIISLSHPLFGPPKHAQPAFQDA